MLHKLYQKEIQVYSIKQQLSKQKQTTTILIYIHFLYNNYIHNDQIQI
jgi:hypothetical protein